MENFRLRVFRAVARHLNFRATAEELLLSQPAISQQIKALEAELNVALFDRGGGRVTLTEAGNVLLSYADKLAALAEEAREAVVATSKQQAKKKYPICMRQMGALCWSVGANWVHLRCHLCS